MAWVEDSMASHRKNAHESSFPHTEAYNIGNAQSLITEWKHTTDTEHLYLLEVVILKIYTFTQGAHFP